MVVHLFVTRAIYENRDTRKAFFAKCSFSPPPPPFWLHEYSTTMETAIYCNWNTAQGRRNTPSSIDYVVPYLLFSCCQLCISNYQQKTLEYFILLKGVVYVGVVQLLITEKNSNFAVPRVRLGIELTTEKNECCAPAYRTMDPKERAAEDDLGKENRSYYVFSVTFLYLFFQPPPQCVIYAQTEQ